MFYIFAIQFKTQTIMQNDLVHQIKKEFFTNTLIISKNLEVPHSNLLRTVKDTIEKIEKQPSRQSIVFLESEFTNKQGRTYKMYEMNEDAYLLLAMQLSQYEKAFQVQVAIVKAFRSMAIALQNHQNVSWLEARKEGKSVRLAETDTIKDFVDYAISQGSTHSAFYYSNLTKLTNKALEFMIQDKTGTPIRDLSSIENLGFIAALEKRASETIKYGMEKEMHYKDIYQYCKAEVNALADVLIFKPRLN
jgi:Rha family phage regulatory protein